MKGTSPHFNLTDLSVGSSQKAAIYNDLLRYGGEEMTLFLVEGLDFY